MAAVIVAELGTDMGVLGDTQRLPDDGGRVRALLEPLRGPLSRPTNSMDISPAAA